MAPPAKNKPAAKRKDPSGAANGSGRSRRKKTSKKSTLTRNEPSSEELVGEQTCNEIREAFRTLSGGDNEGLSVNKTKRCMKRLGIPLATDDIQKAFFPSDDGSGEGRADASDRQKERRVTEDMFVPFAASKILQKEKAERAFRLFDKDGKGIVVLEDLQRVSTELGENLSNDELEEMIRLVDKSDGDGLMLKADFVKIAHRVNL